MSCADVQTIQPGNGVKTQFSFDFPYIFKSEIKVSFWNATTKEWDDKAQNDATYPWQVTDANPTIVEFTGTAPPTPAVPVDPGESAVDNVRIRRVTNIDDIRALFNPGSAIRSDDLNRNFEQLRYAIQESNCQGITEDVYQYLLDNYWDRFDNTVYSTDTWVSDDTKITTTQSIDQRIDNKIDDALTIDIDGSDGITIADDTPSGGQIVVGIGAGSVDLDRIKDEDILTYAEQEAGTPFWDSDGRIPTTYATARRFDTLVQPSTPVGSNWSVGKTWLQNNQDLTLSIWNGSAWLGVASGGTFTNQPKVVYVDASSGDDNNDGHRISRPKLTIKAAIEQINADATYGDGSVVVVAPGVYREVAPIDITKKDVSVIGTALRSCIIHPTSATETNSLFRVNSGTFLQNLTFTGVKATGARGGAGSIDLDPVYGLPVNQGWNVSFYPGVLIYKSPYIQNCTNFSDSEIDNDSLTPHIPGGGSGGDLDSAPTGGGLLIDGSVLASNSPLRSMVCDSYTHVGLDGPGILVTNNGYCQATSSYSFFNHYHIKCLNGGQANLAGSTTDFGRYGLVVDGRSTNAIFTAVTTVDAADGDISFTIGAPVAGSPWHGSATRPQSNMLVDIGGNTYPILSATPNGAGWDVVISRPNALDKAENLGLDGAVLTGAAVSFYLRSMLASSGHTMEYVGSGTNYTALPENGGVPIEANQVVELNNGKVWTATTDHNGKFKVGDFFTVDQQTNAIFISSGSFNVDLQNLQLNPSGNAVIGANLDLNGSDILDSTGNVTIADTLDMNSNAIINLQDPSSANHAATKNYVDTNSLPSGGGTLTGQVLLDNASSPSAPDLAFDGDTNTGIYSPGADQVAVATNGAGRLFVDASGNVGIGTASQTTKLELSANNNGVVQNNTLRFIDTDGSFSAGQSPGRIEFVTSDADSPGTTAYIDTYGYTNAASDIVIGTGIGGSATERLRIMYDGKVGIGTSSPWSASSISGVGTVGDVTSSRQLSVGAGSNYSVSLGYYQTGAAQSFAGVVQALDNNAGTKLLLNPSGGNVGIGTTSPASKLSVVDSSAVQIQAATGTVDFRIQAIDAGPIAYSGTVSNHAYGFTTNNSERARIDSNGRLGIGTSSPAQILHASTITSGGTTSLLISNPNGALGAGAAIKLGVSPEDNTVAKFGIIHERNNTFGGGDTYFCTNYAADATEVSKSDAAITILGSSKRVGIGTTSPQLLLDLKPSSNVPQLQLTQNNANDGWRFHADGPNGGNLYINRWISNTESTKLTVLGSGNVGIGTTTPGANLDLAGTTSRIRWDVNNAYTLQTHANVAFSAFASSIQNAADFQFQTAGTERMRITSDPLSSVLIGQTSNPATSKVVIQVQTGSANGVNAQITSNTGTSFPWANYNATGTYVGGISCTSTATSFPTSSDYRLKTNVQPLAGAIGLVSQLKPSTFEFNENLGETVQGFIAHELQEVVPLAVIGEKDAEDANGNPVYQGVDAAKLVPLLTAALQEAIGRIETLEGMVAVNNITIDEQQHQLSTLAARLTALESA